jgi:sodium transport system permease protein
MRLSNVGLVYRKELLETLRDRRTLISSILLPILLFPVLIIGLGALGAFLALRAVRESPTVMILGAEHAPELVKEIERQEHLELVPPADDYAKRIDAEQLRAAVEIPPALERELKDHPEKTHTVKIFYHEGEFRSERVAGTIEKAVTAFADRTVRERLGQRRLPAAALEPFEIKRQNVAAAEKVTGNILGMLLPYFIILLCMTGAMYPAMDLTAGEKERGTIETLLASPLRRSEIVTGKFLLVLTAAMTTAALSLLSFAGTILGGATLIQRISTRLTIALSIKALAAVLFLILPLAVLFSAGLLAVSLLARNYREAQSYVGPLMLLVIVPAVFSMIPGIELNTRLALVPILNVSLVAKEVFAGQYPWKFLALIFGSTALYAAAAIALAVRMFHREDVLFRS